MREILFRGKRMDNSEWYYGTPIFLNATSAVMMKSALPEQLCVLGERFDAVGQFVDIATIGQYTGLTDKNGKKIFEGDIVRRNAAPMVVAWDSFDGNFITECFIDDVRCVNTLAGHSKLEVIGNIHDNRELLEVEI